MRNTKNLVYSTFRTSILILAALFASGMARAADPVPRVPDATALLNWAERTYPQLFPGPKPNIISGALTYRAYPTTGNYLGVLDNAVLVLGPVIGSTTAPVNLGELSKFACAVFPDSCAAASANTVDAARARARSMVQILQAGVKLGL